MIKRLLALLTLLSVSAFLFSQEVQVKISKDKVRVDGKTYYVHIVQTGETLYSISKAYGISQSDIAISNPDIYAGLKVGQALKIPVSVKETQSDEDYIYHIVKRKETLFGISRMYNVSMDDIIRLNPEVKEGLKLSQTLRIPKKPIADIEQQPAVDSVEFILHEVQPREGLFAISRKYGVSPKEIEYYNYELIKDGLKLGTILRIPKPKVQTVSEVTDAKAKSEMQVKVLPCGNSYNYDGHPFNVALLLPFTQTGNQAQTLVDDVDQKDVHDPTGQLSQITQVSLEFYEGFLLALDTLKKIGISVNLNVHDTKRSSNEVAKIIESKDMPKSDLVIGPYIYEEIKPVAQFAAKNNINFVSPIYSNKEGLADKENVISVSQSLQNQLEIFIKNLKVDPSKNYLVIYDSTIWYSPGLKHFDSLLTQKLSSVGGAYSKYNHKTAAYRSVDVQERLLKMLKRDTVNVVIVPSDDEPFTAEILGSLYAVKSYYNLNTEVYGPSRWRKLKNLPPDYLFALNTHVFSPFYVDYSQKDVKTFVEKYREQFRSEPTQFSFLGYDVAFYFISALKEFGPSMTPCLSTYSLRTLQTNFKFNITKEGYTLNTNQFLIRYAPDFTVSCTCY
ncbi:MAG: LysM peptidoglycan-binding domain-containing protein [Bacteroidota bacterium]